MMHVRPWIMWLEDVRQEAIAMGAKPDEVRVTLERRSSQRAMLKRWWNADEPVSMAARGLVHLATIERLNRAGDARRTLQPLPASRGRTPTARLYDRPLDDAAIARCRSRASLLKGKRP